MNEGKERIESAQMAVANAAAMLEQAPAFRQLEPATQFALRRDLQRLQGALQSPQTQRHDPYAFPLDTPNDLTARLNQQRMGGGTADNVSSPNAQAAPADTTATPAPTATPSGPRKPATETLARRAGALSDELNFPQFVASLVHGTFDAIVDASIRQMEAFADLVSAVAKDVDQFTRENITPNQARDHLAQKYGADLKLELPGAQGGQPRLRAATPSEEGAESSPEWLRDYGMPGETLTDDLVETELVPRAQKELGQQRMQLLATMVLLGMNRVVVKDGTISAKVRFRAAAADKAVVNYAVGQDPNQHNWGERGNVAYDNSALMVSTLGVNVQSDTELKAELFGEVRINFASETLPLDQFMDTAKIALLQRNARKPIDGRPPPITPAAALVPAPALPAAPTVAAAPPAIIAPIGASPAVVLPIAAPSPAPVGGR